MVVGYRQTGDVVMVIHFHMTPPSASGGSPSRQTPYRGHMPWSHRTIGYCKRYYVFWGDHLMVADLTRNKEIDNAET